MSMVIIVYFYLNFLTHLSMLYDRIENGKMIILKYQIIILKKSVGMKVDFIRKKYRHHLYKAAGKI